MHGAEIIGSIAILNFLEKIDPATMCGNVIAVPVANRAGFELGERGSRIDGKDITRQIPGDPNGSACDQIAHVYFQEVISQANVMVDFHAGARTAYERYVLFMEEDSPKNLTEVQLRRRKIVVAFGLDQARLLPARHLWRHRGPNGLSRTRAWCRLRWNLAVAPAGTRTARTTCAMPNVASGTC